MTTVAELEAQVDALESGRGFVDRSRDRLVSVSGPDARRWLNDLVTGRMTDLAVGEGRRSLLLTPTGRIRADFTLSLDPDGSFVIVQAADQEGSVIDILTPYVLSSAVTLAHASDRPAVRWFPGSGRLETSPASGATDAVEVVEAAFERWRVRRGIPLMEVDFAAGSLPAESGLDAAIDDRKGCFLGQESVAKIRNLGHPPTVLRHLRSSVEIARGAPVHTPDHGEGQVTSVVPARGDGWILLARVGWAAAETALSTSDGAPLTEAKD